MYAEFSFIILGNKTFYIFGTISILDIRRYMEHPTAAMIYLVFTENLDIMRINTKRVACRYDLFERRKMRCWLDLIYYTFNSCRKKVCLMRGVVNSYSMMALVQAVGF